MEYRKIYSSQELNELIAWFKQRMDRLPASLQLDAATFIPDFPATVSTYLAIVDAHKENPTYGAQIYMLFRMREKLQESDDFSA